MAIQSCLISNIHFYNSYNTQCLIPRDKKHFDSNESNSNMTIQMESDHGSCGSLERWLNDFSLSLSSRDKEQHIAEMGQEPHRSCSDFDIVVKQCPLVIGV